MSLSLRDWREPTSLAFGLGTVVLVLEAAMVSAGPVGAVLPAVTATWFVGGLASRAASVRLDAPPGALDEAGTSLLGRIRASAILLVGLAAIMAIFIALGGDHGLFELTGKGFLGLFALVITAMGYLLARVLATPLAWAAVHLHLGNWLLRATQRLRRVAPPRPPRGSDVPAGSGRLLGLIVFGIIAFFLFRAIYRRMRTQEEEVREEAEPPVPAAFPLSVPKRLARRLVGNRRELPEDAVRRWYAEALLLLEGRGLSKAPSRTPGEFLPDVVRAFPAAAAGFTALTRAYEDVRYGNLLLDAPRLLAVEANRRIMLDGIRATERAEDPTLPRA